MSGPARGLCDMWIYGNAGDDKARALRCAVCSFLLYLVKIYQCFPITSFISQTEWRQKWNSIGLKNKVKSCVFFFNLINECEHRGDLLYGYSNIYCMSEEVVVGWLSRLLIGKLMDGDRITHCWCDVAFSDLHPLKYEICAQSRWLT